MRFMIIVKATRDSEAGVLPEEKLLAEMAEYHEELTRAGVLLDANGLQPSSKGWRIRYFGGPAHRDRRTVRRDEGGDRRLHGHSGEFEGGSARLGEALSQSRRGKDAEIEIRQVFELEDFGESEAIERFRDMEAARK